MGNPPAVLGPRITIVTPSFNQAAFLEETVRSIRAQGYGNLEHFVVDGGSTDGSAALIERLSGGIDLTADKMNLNIKDNGQALEFKIDAAMMSQLQSAPGFVPVIIDIKPVGDLPAFLGLK